LIGRTAGCVKTHPDLNLVATALRSSNENHVALLICIIKRAIFVSAKIKLKCSVSLVTLMLVMGYSRGESFSFGNS